MRETNNTSGISIMPRTAANKNNSVLGSTLVKKSVPTHKRAATLSSRRRISLRIK